MAIGRPLAIFVVSRIVVLLTFGVTMVLAPNLTFAKVAGAWDAGWYMDIARHGYPAHVSGVGAVSAQNSTAFYPLFPLLLRGFMRVSGFGALRAGIVVATVASAGAVVVVWFMVDHLADRGAADRAAALLCFFPAAFVLSMPFSEGLMLLFAAGCILALLHQQWLVAGLCAAAASATRPTGLACFVACAFAALVAIRDRRAWLALVAPALAPVGVVAYFVYLKRHTGDFLASYHSQRFGWHQNVDFGVTTVHAIGRAFTHPLHNFNNVAVAAALALAAIGAWYLVRASLPAVVGVYALAAVVPALLAASTASRPRYVLAAFPLVVAPALKLRGLAFAVVLATLACLMVMTEMLTVSMLWLTA